MATQQIREEIKTYAASGFVPDTATFEALLEMARRWANTEHRRLERDAVRTRERMAAPSPASGTIDAIRVLSLQIMANAKATWADLLDETFRLPDGTVTTWGSATVRQHQIRAEALQDNAAGSVTTAARHLRVSWKATRAGVDQVGGVLADVQDARTDEPVMLRDALGAPLTLPTEGEVGQPAVGDLWVVSADGQDRGVVMISAVRDLHVLAWPVTLPTSAAAAPAFLITLPDTGGFVAWPDAEFGLALAALDRRLAHVLDDRTTRTVRWGVTEDEPVDSVSTCPAVDTPEAVAAFEAVCSQAWALGDWAWPDNTIGEAALSQDALSAAGVEIAQLAQALGVKPGRASALARGVKVPTPEEVATILSLLPAGTVAGDILEPVDGADAVVLSLPEYKSRVRRLSAERTVPERRARTMVWEQACSRAARQVAHTAPLEAARARVDYALEELMGGT